MTETTRRVSDDSVNEMARLADLTKPSARTGLDKVYLDLRDRNAEVAALTATVAERNAANDTLAARVKVLEEAHHNALAVGDKSMAHPDLRQVIKSMRAISLAALSATATEEEPRG